MSSQGANSTTITPGYDFTRTMLRDSSDWTTYLKQRSIQRENTNYFGNPQKRAQTQDPWIPNGQGYRLNVLNGRFKCLECNGGAFNS